MYSWTIRNYIFHGEEIEIYFTKNKEIVIESLVLSNADTLLLQKHLKAKTLPEIREKQFSSPKDNITSAVELLLLKIKNNGVYRSPSHQKVLQICIQSLAKMQSPDFSNIDKDTIFKAFHEVWGRGLTPNKKWLEALKKAIKEQSRGMVTLEETKVPKKKLPAVLGPHYYLDLVSRFGRRQTFFIGPYDTPIKFLK